MITTILNVTKTIFRKIVLEECFSFLFWLNSHLFTWSTEASHQGAIKEPAASLLRMSETHPGIQPMDVSIPMEYQWIINSNACHNTEEKLVTTTVTLQL